MLSQAQKRKLNKIQGDVEELLESDTSANEVLRQTVQQGAPIFMGFMQGKTPPIQSLQAIATNILAVVLASTKESNTMQLPNVVKGD